MRFLRPASLAASLALGGAIAAAATATAPATRPAPPPPTRPALPATRPAITPPARGVRPSSATPQPRSPAGSADALPPLPALPPGPLGPGTRPAVAPARTAASAWYAVARLRLEAMRYAAEELPLEPTVKATLAARVIRARTAADLAAAADDTAAAAKTIDAVMANLQIEADETLGGGAGAFSTRVGQVMGEARDLGRLESSGTRTLLDILFVSTAPASQRAALTAILADNRVKLEPIIFGPKDGSDLRRYEIGLSTRAAFRAALTPGQLRQWDGLSSPTTRRSPATAPATRPAAEVAEVEAGYAIRFEVMRLAAQEGQYDADRRTRLLARIEAAKAAVAAAAAEPITSGQKEPPANRIDKLVKVDLARAIVEILGGVGTDDFNARIGRLNGQVITLHNPDLPLDHTWVGDEVRAAPLSADQKAQIDRVLSDRVAKLKAVDHEAKADDSPAVVRMRKDQVALATRAAVRAVLNKEQLKAWDGEGPVRS